MTGAVDITPEGSAAPVYLVEAEPEDFGPLGLDEAEAQRVADREAAVGKLRLLGLTDAEISAVFPQ